MSQLTGPTPDPTPDELPDAAVTDDRLLQAASGPAPAAAGLGARAARSAVFSMGSQVIKAVIQILSVVVLARLLSPHDYGVVAMVAVVLGIGDIFRDFGLSSAAVQTKSLSTAQRDNLFWLNTAIGAILAACMVPMGYVLLALYHEPVLPVLCAWLGLSFLVNGMSTQYRASLERGLLFNRIAVADSIAPLLALVVAILAARAGWGYWALVAQTLSMATLSLLFLGIANRWLPGLPKPRTSMDGMLRFGWNMVLTQLLGYAANNTDNFIVGLRNGSDALGLYNRAFQLLMQPYNLLRVPMTRVAIPVLSRVNEDPVRFMQLVARGQLILGYGIGVPLAIVAGVGQPLTSVMLGERWAAVGPLFTCFAVAAIFQTLSFVCYWIYVSKGLTGHLMRYTLWSGPLRMAIILVGSHWGISGVALAYAFAPIVLWPLSFWWLGKRVSLPYRELYTAAARVCTTCLVTGSVAFVVCRLGVVHLDVLRVLVGAVAGLGVCALLAFAAPPVRRDLQSVVAAASLIRR